MALGPSLFKVAPEEITKDIQADITLSLLFADDKVYWTHLIKHLSQNGKHEVTP